MLMEQLLWIRARIQSGKLQGRNVVINMSLEIPDDNDLQGSNIELSPARKALRAVILSLSKAGVIFVASAGNEGDRRYEPLKQEHPGALYPAAYAYPLGEDEGVDTMVPVGAVNHKGEVASYSCYPGPRGVSTYGGDIPHSFTDKDMTKVDKHTIDAIIGVYTQLSYPALSIDDTEATYPVPNAHGWAYWIGTSFATPVISAIMARAIELRQQTSTPGLEQPIDIIRYAAGTATVKWPAGSGGRSEDTEEPVIRAMQCRPRENGFVSHMKEAAELFTET
jgi:hypothetical protein